jgi:CRISPR-associated Cas5-like protein
LKALTFKVKFITAQFKDHLSKLSRKTYFIPPPSSVAGIFGAIVGLDRKSLAIVSKELLAGAQMISLGGRAVTLARLYKFDRPGKELAKLVKKYYEDKNSVLKDIRELLTIKESEELYSPEYKLAVASSNESLIDNAFERIRNYEFEYDVFGGNDYHFVEFIGEPRLAEVKKSREGYGYCPSKYFERIEAQSFAVVHNKDSIQELVTYPLVVPVMFLANVNKEFLQVYGAKVILSKEIDVVDDGESKIFVYNVGPFLKYVD